MDGVQAGNLLDCSNCSWCSNRLRTAFCLLAMLQLPRGCIHASVSSSRFESNASQADSLQCCINCRRKRHAPIGNCRRVPTVLTPDVRKPRRTMGRHAPGVHLGGDDSHPFGIQGARTPSAKEEPWAGANLDPCVTGYCGGRVVRIEWSKLYFCCRVHIFLRIPQYPSLL